MSVTVHYCTLEVANHAVDPAYWTNACGQACAAALQSVQESPFHCPTSHRKSGLHLKSEFVTSARGENTVACTALLVVLTVRN